MSPKFTVRWFIVLIVMTLAFLVSMMITYTSGDLLLGTELITTLVFMQRTVC